MKTLSLRSPTALTSAIRAPPLADELQDKIRVTFWPPGTPGSGTGFREASSSGWRNGETVEGSSRNRHGPPAVRNHLLSAGDHRRDCHYCSRSSNPPSTL